MSDLELLIRLKTVRIGTRIGIKISPSEPDFYDTAARERGASVSVVAKVEMVARQQPSMAIVRRRIYPYTTDCRRFSVFTAQSSLASSIG